MNNFVGQRSKTVLVLVAGLLAAASARADEPCGLCPTAIVTNSALASCFLDEYQQLAKDNDGAVAVDLSNCETYRGVIEPLPMPGVTVLEPDVQFMLTRAQLDCLKGKLEEPGLELDPSKRIELDRC
jgi:hypothetical protein